MTVMVVMLACVTWACEELLVDQAALKLSRLWRWSGCCGQSWCCGDWESWILFCLPCCSCCVWALSCMCAVGLVTVSCGHVAGCVEQWVWPWDPVPYWTNGGKLTHVPACLESHGKLWVWPWAMWCHHCCLGFQERAWHLAGPVLWVPEAPGSQNTCSDDHLKETGVVLSTWSGATSYRVVLPQPLRGSKLLPRATLAPPTPGWEETSCQCQCYWEGWGQRQLVTFAWHPRQMLLAC